LKRDAKRIKIKKSPWLVKIAEQDKLEIQLPSSFSYLRQRKDKLGKLDIYIQDETANQLLKSLTVSEILQKYPETCRSSLKKRPPVWVVIWLDFAHLRDVADSYNLEIEKLLHDLSHSIQNKTANIRVKHERIVT
jgi:hypothetical protein